MSLLEGITLGVGTTVILVFPLYRGLLYKVHTTLQAATFYQLARALGTCDPLHLEPVVP
jgi:hypothetical protein